MASFANAARVSAALPSQASKAGRSTARLASNSVRFFSARASLTRSLRRKPAKTFFLTSVLTVRRGSAIGRSGYLLGRGSQRERDEEAKDRQRLFHVGNVS